MFSGIRPRLISYYLLVIAVVVLVMGSFFVWFLNYFYLETLRSHLFSQAGLAVRLIKEAELRGASEKDLDLLCKDLGRQFSVRLTLIDPDGRVVGDSTENPLQMENHLHRPEIQEAREFGRGAASRFSATLGEDMLYAAVSILGADGMIPAGYLRLALPLSQINSAVIKLRLFILGVLVFSSIAALLVGIILSRKITKPLNAISKAAHAIASGDFVPPLNIQGRDEMADLARTITEMGRSLQKKVDEITLEKNKLETVLSSLDSGIILVDRNARIELLNPTAERLFSISWQEVVGLPLQSTLRYYSLHEHLLAALQEGESQRFELHLYYPSSLVLQTSLVPVIGEKGNVAGVLTIFFDITRIRTLEKMRSDFVANVSHELRTPLTAVKGYAETILHEPMSRKQLREFLIIIEREAGRLARLVDSLLDLSQIEERKNLLPKTAVNLNALIRDALLDVEEARLLKEISLGTRLPAEPVNVSGNYDWLRQALVNVFDNSVKYGRPGGSISVDLTVEKKNLILEIGDNGPGIPAEDLPYVFERFYRVDKARSRKGGGTGLGLAIVKHIMEAHGATYGIRSEPGRGAVFYLSMPVAEP